MGWKNKWAIISFHGDRKILLVSWIMHMESMQGLTHQKWWSYAFLIFMTSVTCRSVWGGCFLTPSREAHFLCQALEFSALFRVRVNLYYFLFSDSQFSDSKSWALWHSQPCHCDLFMFSWIKKPFSPGFTPSKVGRCTHKHAYYSLELCPINSSPTGTSGASISKSYLFSWKE